MEEHHGHSLEVEQNQIGTIQLVGGEIHGRILLIHGQLSNIVYAHLQDNHVLNFDSMEDHTTAHRHIQTIIYWN